MAVHITGGPTPWDYVVGSATILATVVGFIAIVLALKAGNDLKQDRRNVFELGVLLDLLERIGKSGSVSSDIHFHTYAKLLPESEIPALYEWLFKPKLPRETGDYDTDLNARSEYQSDLRKRTDAELRAAIDRRIT